MEDIQEKEKFKMKNKGEEAMESWREIYIKVGNMQGLRDMGKDDAFKKPES